MATIIKIIWILAIVFNFALQTYFLIGATAFFNRATGLEWGIYLRTIWIVMMILIIVSIICLILGRIPLDISSQVKLIVLIVIITILSIIIAPTPIQKEGWLDDRVSVLHYTPSSEILVQTTEDGKYEYFLEVINSFQRNSRAQLFVRNVATGEETRIHLDMKNPRISTRLGGTPNRERAWSHLVISDTFPLIYILTTTWYLNDMIESFEICMETKTSRRID